MRKIAITIISLNLFACNGIHGWFPGWDDNPKTSATQPTQGCYKDIAVHYKNNCSKSLVTTAKSDILYLQTMQKENAQADTEKQSIGLIANNQQAKKHLLMFAINLGHI